MISFALACIASLLPVAVVPRTHESVRELCERFSPFDQDADGELELLRVVPRAHAGDGGARVLLLVEERLVGAPGSGSELEESLARWARDLAEEGYSAEVLSVALASSQRHRDGRRLLALRELLRAFQADGGLAGALLVGHFPDAYLVRTCNWRKRGEVRLHAGTERESVHPDVHYLRRVPEAVAHKADLVLSDLDGRWEELYVEPRTRLETVLGVFEGAIPAAGGPCVGLERGSVSFEDFFLVSDGKCEVLETVDSEGEPGGFALLLDDRSADHEVSAEDRARPNVLARPEIVVSRVDARGIALRPRRELRGVDGTGLLDETGRPQALEFASEAEVPHWREGIWELDAELERRLLLEFFERNHAYRVGASPVARRPASIACDLGSGLREMTRAATDWEEADEGLCDLQGRPTLEDFAAWLASPALLRTVRAHSDPWGSVFARGDLATLEASLEGEVWSWTPRGTRLEPSLAAACGGGKLDWFLLRSLWEADAVPREPSFYHHTGCEAISPPGAAHLAYDAPGYGLRQGAEALLFYGGGLALVGRAKVFYDEPRGFAGALGEGETFGAAWARYFELESEAATWNAVGGDIGRKRAYFWSVLGDWTLRLRRG